MRATTQHAATPCILYLHGRHASPDEPPGDLIAAVNWPCPLNRPEIDDAFLRRPFADQMRAVDGWLGSALLAIGHSYGAWLLLCGALDRLERGRPIPPLLLISAVLGAGGRGTGESGSIPPRARRVRQALGLGHGTGVRFAGGAIGFIHGGHDDQCPVEAVRALSGTQNVCIIPGGHRLTEPEARIELWKSLERWRPAAPLLHDVTVSSQPAFTDLSTVEET
jgi:hypothetical protein